MKTSIFLALLLSAVGGHAQTVLPEASEIRCVTRQMGVPVQGRFARWQAQLRFDPRQPQAAEVAFSIDTRSISFGAAETETEAARPLWFDSGRFAQAQLGTIAPLEVEPMPGLQETCEATGTPLFRSPKACSAGGQRRSARSSALRVAERSSVP